MQLTCPSCAATYDVPDGAIGPDGRRVRCRACDTSWREPGRAAASPPEAAPPAPAPAPVPAPPPAAAAPKPEPAAFAVPPRAAPAPAPAARPGRKRGAVLRRRLRMPLLVTGLGAAVVGLGAITAVLAFGPEQVASRLGLTDQHSPLGISITRMPDWRLIAGGSQLFAVSGRIWNPTGAEQSVPDIRAELKDARGRTVYSWIIARPVQRLAPGAAASFDGAAVDVPASSVNVSVSFARPAAT